MMSMSGSFMSDLMMRKEGEMVESVTTMNTKHDLFGPMGNDANVGYKLHVKGLPYDVTTKQLYNIFKKKYGEPTFVVVIRDKHLSNKNRGYGFVTFKHQWQSEIAINEPPIYRDRTLIVSKAHSSKNNNNRDKLINKHYNHNKRYNNNHCNVTYKHSVNELNINSYKKNNQFELLKQWDKDLIKYAKGKQSWDQVMNVYKDNFHHIMLTHGFGVEIPINFIVTKPIDLSLLSE
mmetsp:Transcript_43674/g.53584  ORF Transcript_43674/g.53584 Transcript_43674/m.53584 type:complete len:233 (+) Transcript_43674:85-783(+)